MILHNNSYCLYISCCTKSPIGEASVVTFKVALIFVSVIIEPKPIGLEPRITRYYAVTNTTHIFDAKVYSGDIGLTLETNNK